MAITRSDLSTQIQKSTSFPALLATDNANEAYWFLPPSGSDQLLFFDFSGTVLNWATLGSGLTMVDNVLNTVSTGSSYSEIQEEGNLVGSGNTKINFIGSGITAANAGSSVTSITLDATLNALSQFNTNGLLVQTASDTFAGRTLTGTTNRISVTNADGVSGNPTINISTSFGSSGLSDAANIALLNGNQTFTGDNTFNNNIVMNATATLGTHLMTKAQTEALILDRKASSVDAATTAHLDPDLDIYNGAVIDGYTLNTGDRLLVKNNSDASKNGYYDVPALAPATRSADMNTAGEVKGSLTLVLNGGQAGLIFYTLSNVNTLGVEDIIFTQLATGTINGIGATNSLAYWVDADTLTYDPNLNFISNSLVLGHTTPAASTKFTTRGSGTTSSTFGWKHQNSSGTVTAIVADNGQVTLGSGGEVLIASTATNYTNGAAYAISKTGGNLNISSDASITFAGGGTASSTPSVLFNTTRQDLSNNQLNARFAGIFSPSGAGTNTYTEVDIAPVINQTTHTGATRSVYIHPTLTSVGSGGHTALEIAASGQRALRTTAGSVQFDLGSDASRDLLFRTTTGILGRIPYGTTGQVLIATTGSDPSWGAVPTAVSEAYWEPTSSSTTVDLDTGTSVKDVDGTNIAFTVPSDLKKLHIYRNGYHQSMTGTLTIRDYTVNTSTHVVTFTVSVEDGEIIKFVKFA